MTLKVITANRLIDGKVVWLGAKSWCEDINDAQTVIDESQMEALSHRAEKDESACQIVSHYPVQIEKIDGDLRPMKYREVIRAFGPSVAIVSNLTDQPRSSTIKAQRLERTKYVPKI